MVTDFSLSYLNIFNCFVSTLKVKANIFKPHKTFLQKLECVKDYGAVCEWSIMTAIVLQFPRHCFRKLISVYLPNCRNVNVTMSDTT